MINKNRKDGLTEQEGKVMDLAVKCYEEFLKINGDEFTHPDDARDFVDAVHIIQGILASRIVRREYPDEWGSPLKRRQK